MSDPAKKNEPINTMPSHEEPPMSLWTVGGKSTSTANLNIVTFVQPGLEGYDANARAKITRGLSQRGTVKRGSFRQYIDE
jgi:hypothetical protein